MWNFNEVKALTYKGGHVLHVVFDDGVEGDLDCSQYVGRGPVFEPLRDPAFVRTARIEHGTVAWPNGADIAPETLYEKLAAAKPAAAPAMGVGESPAGYSGAPARAQRKKRSK